MAWLIIPSMGRCTRDNLWGNAAAIYGFQVNCGGECFFPMEDRTAKGIQRTGSGFVLLCYNQACDENGYRNTDPNPSGKLR